MTPEEIKLDYALDIEARESLQELGLYLLEKGYYVDQREQQLIDEEIALYLESSEKEFEEDIPHIPTSRNNLKLNKKRVPPGALHSIKNKTIRFIPTRKVTDETPITLPKKIRRGDIVTKKSDNNEEAKAYRIVGESDGVLVFISRAPVPLQP